MPWRRWLLIAGLILAAVPRYGSADTATQESSGRTASVQHEGHDLYQAILQAYSQGLKSSRGNVYVSGLNITSVVSHYIEIGMSFDRAEQILRAAGLNVSGRPGPDEWSSNRADKFAVSAYAYEYFNRSLMYRFFRPIYKDYSRKLFITLFPERPGDYSKIAKMTAVIAFSSL